MSVVCVGVCVPQSVKADGNFVESVLSSYLCDSGGLKSSQWAFVVILLALVFMSLTQDYRKVQQ